jgi:predicted nucleic acid-binding protein
LNETAEISRWNQVFKHVLSKQGKPIGGKFDGDVFIAAYCLVNSYTLITNNKDHFERINGLKFVKWAQ